MPKSLKEINKSVLAIFLLLAALWACEPREEQLDLQYAGGVGLSVDTLYFDTLFTSRGSTTKRFYVKNPHGRAIKISRIWLGGESNSAYNIAVNGRFGDVHKDITILGHDSLLVLVEALIDPKDQNLPFLVKDSVLFETNGKTQDVKLISWGQDAHFLGDVVLPCNTKWTNDKPYVLYKSVLVDSLCSLEIEKGVRIFCAPNTFIYVKGTLKINGEAGQRVVVRNDRLEPKYQDAPGQWGGLVFLEGSKDNRIAFATIRNGQTALRVGTPDQDTVPDVVLKNTIIENMSESGILGFTSDVYADNSLINNCGQFTVANFAGGNYTYINCTFANYSFDFFREMPATVFSDYVLLDDQSEIKANLKLTLINNIIYGDLDNEIAFDFSEETQVTLLLRNNLLKTNLDHLNINFNILNEDPKFKSPFNFEFQLDSLSPAINQGVDVGLIIDIDSTTRDPLPDVGAYEYKSQ